MPQNPGTRLDHVFSVPARERTNKPSCRDFAAERGRLWILDVGEQEAECHAGQKHRRDGREFPAPAKRQSGFGASALNGASEASRSSSKSSTGAGFSG